MSHTIFHQLHPRPRPRPRPRTVSPRCRPGNVCTLNQIRYTVPDVILPLLLDLASVSIMTKNRLKTQT